MARYSRIGRSSRRGGGLFKMFAYALVASTILASLAILFLLFEFEKPQLVLEREPKYLGGRIELPMRITDRRSGIRSISITLSQGGRNELLLARSFPRNAWVPPAGPTSFADKVPVDAQKAGFKEGPAELAIIVRDFSLMGLFKGNKAELRLPVTIDTKPPRVAIGYSPPQLHTGGSGAVVYTVTETPSRNGVEIDQTFFPAFPTGKKDTFIAYVALPWDAKKPGKIQVIATDEAGNGMIVPLSVGYRKEPEKKDNIIISDHFLSQKIPEFSERFPKLEGSALQKYLTVNNQVRDSNAATIAKLCSTTAPEQLWSDRFLRMPGAKRAGFAEQRTYTYNGEAIDQQTHLGIDIASVEKAGIRAANRGKVVFADYLGIYGNMVLIDHGQGIFSLYSHLSRIDTRVGAMVNKDQPIGLSGTTGMAGGDHLHFSMLVHGIFVTPVEWWDQHWIDVHIKAALNAK